MALVNNLHHIAFVTADMDRLSSFCERVFDARVTLDVEDPVRHAFIEIGPHSVLHPFEVPADEVPTGSRCSSAGASTISRQRGERRRRSRDPSPCYRRERACDRGRARHRHGRAAHLHLPRP